MIAAAELTAAVRGYAGRLHRAAGATHHVVSPLGAWLVLALAAAAGPGDGALADALGCPPDEAADIARRLLAQPHSAVALAAAVWGAPLDDPGRVGEWIRALADVVESGPVPDQAGADRWAREHTFGLIEQFPVEVAGAALVLASAVATRIEWRQPFETMPAARARLTRGAGFAALQTLLRDNDRCPGHRALAGTRAGPVAVHAVPAHGDDLVVVSVIADPSVPAETVLDLAHPIATAIARGEPVPGELSLFDLPLGTGQAWTMREAPAARDRQEITAVLPAWSAKTDLDLMADESLGFTAAAGLLARMLGADGPARAKQAALARYTRTGFEAAAVTSVVAVSAMVAAERGRHRTAVVEFTRPYAVVAVATGAPDSPWCGVPVFSGWVDRGDEPD